MSLSIAVRTISAFFVFKPLMAFMWLETPWRVMAKCGYRQFSDGPIRSHQNSIVATSRGICDRS